MYGTLKAASAIKNQVAQASETQPLTQDTDSDDDGGAAMEAGHKGDAQSGRQITPNDDSTDDDLSQFTDENDSDFEEKLEHELLIAKFEEEGRLLHSGVTESGRKMNANDRLRYEMIKRRRNEEFSVLSLISKYLCCFCGCNISSMFDDCITTLMSTVILPYYALTLIGGAILLLFIALQKSNSSSMMQEMFYVILILSGIGALLGCFGEIYYALLIEKLNKEIVIYKHSNRNLRAKIDHLSVNRDRLAEFNDKLAKQRTELRMQTDRLIVKSPQLRRLLKKDRLFDQSESHLLYDFFVLLSLTRLNEWVFYVELFFDCCGVTTLLPSRLGYSTAKAGHSLLSPSTLKRKPINKNGQKPRMGGRQRSATISYQRSEKGGAKRDANQRGSHRKGGAGGAAYNSGDEGDASRHGWADITDRTGVAPSLRLSFAKFRRLLDRLPNDKAEELMDVAMTDKLFTDFSKVTESSGFWTKRISNKEKPICIDTFLDQLCEPLISQEIEEMSEELFTL